MATLLVVILALLWAHSYGYLLFHTLVELFTVVVGGSIFAIAWNSRRYHDDSSLLYLGVTFLSVAAIDLVHAVAYKGMGVLPPDADHATQLWVASRYVKSLCLLAFPLMVGRRVQARLLVAASAAVVTLVLLSICRFGIFPTCYIEGVGLTPFKRDSEYIICGLLVLGIFGILSQRERMDRRVLYLLTGSMAVTVLQELSFTLYDDPYGPWNMLGHLLKVVAFYMVYKGIIERGLSRPYELLFFDLKKHERALENSEATLRQFMDNSPVMMGLVELNDDGSDLIHVYDNAKTIRFMGGKSMVGAWMSQRGASPEHVRQVVARYRQSDAEDRPVRFEMEVYEEAAGGGPRLLEMVVSPVGRGPTGRKRFCFVGNDVTDRKAVELSLQAAKAAAEDASRAKDHFISSLSHELRTPLTPVLAAVGVWRGEAGLPPDMRQDLDMIERNIGLEVALISDLLDVTRIANGKLALSRQQIDLGSVVRNAAEICRGESPTAQIHIELRGEAYTVMGDSARLHQVFWNLIKNAIKFSPPRGRITVEGIANGDEASVSVTDAGVGISATALPHIFTAFEQGDHGETYGGLGLGLAIARGVIEAHGGRLIAYSEGENKGATFTVHLPLSKLPRVDVKARRGPMAARGETPDAPRRILLVEDHVDTVRAVTRLLERHGHTVTSTGRAEDAVTLATTEVFDVMISDLGLPGRSGMDLLRELRDRGVTLPAIAVSGFGQPSDIEKSIAAGFCSHLVKPVEPTQLLAAINSAADPATQATA